MDYILEKEKPRDAIKALESLPKNMADAYEEVLFRIDQHRGKHTALQVLSWLFYAQRPLTLEEIQEVLSIEIKPPDTDLYSEYFMDPAHIIHCCQGLVEVEDNSKIIRFTHYTVQEFLKDKYLAKLLSPSDLAKVCLTYLTFDVFERGPCSSEETYRERMESYRFTDYAMKYLGCYIRGEGEEDSAIVHGLLRLFRSNRKCDAIRQHRVLTKRPWNFEFDKLYTWTPLHIISQEGLTAVYDKLASDSIYRMPGENVELGSVDSKDEDNETPLHLAVSGGHKGMVERLLRSGADPTAADNDGRTALHWAAWEGHKEVIEILLRSGANIAAVDKYGRTVVHWAAGGGHKDLAEMLLINGADTTADKDGRTPMHCAARGGHKDVVEMLLRKGVDAGIVDRYGRTAVHCAARGGHKDVVEILLSRGVGITSADEHRRTALRWAAHPGHKDMVEMLLTRGADTEDKVKDDIVE